MKILVVSNFNPGRKDLAVSLKELHYVDEAESYEQVRELLLKNTYHWVFVDMSSLEPPFVELLKSLRVNTKVWLTKNLPQ